MTDSASGKLGRARTAIVSKVLHTYFRFSRGLTLGVRAAIFDPEGRILLIRHTYVVGWHLPGGGVETGETALAALRREVFEEARIVLTGPPELHGVFFNRRMSRRDHVLVYTVREYLAEGEKVPDREIAEAGFFALGELPKGTSAATRRRLAEIVKGEPASDFW